MDGGAHPAGRGGAGGRTLTGIGKGLFHRIATAARLACARRMRAVSSLIAEPFYTRTGLRRLALRHIPLGGKNRTFPVVLMEGDLVP